MCACASMVSNPKRAWTAHDDDDSRVVRQSPAQSFNTALLRTAAGLMPADSTLDACMATHRGEA